MAPVAVLEVEHGEGREHERAHAAHAEPVTIIPMARRASRAAEPPAGQLGHAR